MPILFISSYYSIFLWCNVFFSVYNGHIKMKSDSLLLVLHAINTIESIWKDTIQRLWL